MLEDRNRRRVSPAADARKLPRFSIATLGFALVMLAGISRMPALAQVIFGSIVGTVTDSSGAAVAGATVKLTSLGTNESRTTTTGSAGTY